MPPLSRTRRGLSLLEILAVVTLLGILTAVATARFGSTALQGMAVSGDARRLAVDLLQCQRRAIAYGSNHYLEFTSSGGAVVGYTLYRRTSSAGGVAVDEYRPFCLGESVVATHTQMEFTFDGSAAAAYQVTFSGANRTAQVTVVPVTGAIRVQ